VCGMRAAGGPFRGRTRGVMLAATPNRGPPPPRQVNPEVPAALERVVVKALEKDRDRRYQTAADLRADLQRLKREAESGRVGAAGPAGAPRPRRPWRAAATGGGGGPAPPPPARGP